MNVSVVSELMKNQKQGVLPPSSLDFEVVQTVEGDTIFFSIEEDSTEEDSSGSKHLYATRELPGTSAGWKRVSLSSDIRVPVENGSSPSAKMFVVSQNPRSLALDIALVVTVSGTDYLYLSTGNSNNSEQEGISWRYIKFDHSQAYSSAPYTILNVYLANNHNFTSNNYDNPDNALNYFVDILRSPTENDLIDRYLILPNSTVSEPAWQIHNMGGDVSRGSVVSCLGRRLINSKPEAVSGIYTYGTIGTERVLRFTQAYDPEGGNDQQSVDLKVPKTANSIASAIQKDGTTNLFIAASDGLYFIPADSQFEKHKPKHIVKPASVVENNLFDDNMSLVVSTVANTTNVWCLNSQGYLFQISCPAGSEGDSAQWSAPLPFSTGVQTFAFYLNYPSQYNVLFARSSDAAITQHIQDPITSLWRRKSILLPSDSVHDMQEYNTFTSHIVIRNSNNDPCPRQEVQIFSDGPLSAWINGKYTNMSSPQGVVVTADVSGCISVVQEAQSLSAVCFRIRLSDRSSLRVDPLSNATNTLTDFSKHIDDSNPGDALTNVHIPTSDGGTEALVTGTQDTATAGAALKSLVGVQEKLKSSNGAQSTNSSVHSLSALNVGSQKFEADPGCHKMHTSWGQRRHRKKDSNRERVTPKDAMLGGFSHWIECAVGDLIAGAKALASDVEKYVIQPIVHGAETVYHLVIQFGKAVYHAVLDTISSVIAGIEWVLDQIEVGIEKLVAWLGFLFSWNDILRTHRVVKNVLVQYCSNITKKVTDGSLKTNMNQMIEKFRIDIKSWGGLNYSGKSMSQLSSENTDTAGTDSPQSNWGLQHTKNGLSSAQASDDNSSGTTDLDSCLEKLGKTLTDELVNQIQSSFSDLEDIFTSITQQDPFTAVQKVLATLGDLLLGIVEDITDAVLDLFSIVMKNFLDLLQTKLDIPVISPMYKFITGDGDTSKGDDLSFLDLICLVCAIPATIGYKIVSKDSPFPDDSTTNALITSDSWDAIAGIISGDANLQVNTLGQPMLQGHVSDGAQNLDLHPTLQALGGSNSSLLHRLSISLNIIGGIGGLVNVYVADLRRNAGEMGYPAIMPVQACLSVVSYAAFCAPDMLSVFQDRDKALAQNNIWNDTMTGLAILKTFTDNLVVCDSPSYRKYLDKGSPWVEMVINFTWLGPAIWAVIEGHDNDTGSDEAWDWIAFVQNLAFDVGGIITPGAATAINKTGTANGLFSAQIGCNFFYFGACIALCYDSRQL